MTCRKSPPYYVFRSLSNVLNHETLIIGDSHQSTKACVCVCMSVIAQHKDKKTETKSE